MPRFGPKDANEREIFAIENFRADLQQVIHSTMQRKKVSRQELARRLDCSPANVTQLLSENANPRIETVARIFYALGDEAKISSHAFDEIRAQETLRDYIETLASVLAKRDQDMVFQSHRPEHEEVSSHERKRKRTGQAAPSRDHKQGYVKQVMLASEGGQEGPRWKPVSTNRNPNSPKFSEDAVKAA